VRGVDYTTTGDVNGTNVVFGANQTKARIFVSPVSTAVNFVYLTMQNLPSWTVDFWGSSNLVTVTTPTAEAVEGGGAQTITVQRGGTAGNFSVFLYFSGGVQAGTDHNLNSQQVLFGEGR
jgi:hypothetical protein